MAEILYMPKLSDTMEKGTVVKWYKNIGEEVKEGDLIADIETDKAIQEFESEFDGFFLYKAIEENQELPVEEILAIIGNKDEDISTYLEKLNKPIQTKNPQTKVQSNSTIDALVIKMPMLSDTMTTGTISAWYKNVGDFVKEGEVLADIETDKATQEFESEKEGTLLYIGAKEGENLSVDSVLAILGDKNADVKEILKKFELEKPVITEFENKQKPLKVEEKSNSAAEENNKKRIFASPLAKSLANQYKIVLSQISGTGPNGRIVKEDVEEFLQSNKNSKESFQKTNHNQKSLLQETQTPHSNTRKTIAKRLSESMFTAPHYYLKVEVDMDALILHRNALNKKTNKKISFNDWIVKAVASSIELHPKINSSWHQDYIQYHSKVNIGVAVAIDDGLVVPVIRDANLKSIIEISDEIAILASKSRDKTIKANELEGSTFTISNLGAFGIESFTSIINQPNACILSVGAIVEKPVVKNGVVVVGNRMKLNLACDHRLVDGAVGSQFLQTLKEMLEVPGLIFI